MESVINNAYINSYADTLSKIVCDRYFEEKDTISGEDILSLTNIKQVNMMVIKNLLSNWEKESEKLKSPYFNYDSDLVKDALDQLMNVLSRNINVTKKDFIPLFRNALRDILYLIYSPYEFFKTEITTLHNPFTLISVQKRKKFIKVNASLFDTFLTALEETGKDNFSHTEALNLFDNVCSKINFAPDEPKDIFANLSAMLLLDEDQIYKEDMESVEQSTRSAPKDRAGKPIHEQYYVEKETLADKLKKEDKNTVLDFHQSQKIESLRKNISIHQKFMFLRELFNNDDSFFNEVIDHLDKTTETEIAKNYLKAQFYDTGKWDNENETVQEFLVVFSKKFH